MRVLFVCHEPIPSVSTSTEQLMKAAAAMAGLGVEVVVSTSGTPSGDAGSVARRVSEFYGINPALFGSGLSLAHLRAPEPIRGGLRRPWHDVRVARFAQRGSFDLVYVRDPIPLVTALLTDKPVVFETYRYDLNTRVSYAPWRAFCYRRSGLVGVVAHSDMARRSFVDVGFPDEAVLVAHNGYDPPDGAAMGRREARRHLGLDPHTPLVVYTGGVVRSKGLESILSVAEALPDVDFLVVGHVPGSAGARWFEALVATRSVTNVRMIPRIPPASVPVYLSAGDCLFVPTASGPLYRTRRTVLPMKTFQYLGAGKPIVAPDLPDVGEILRDGENALLVPPDRVRPTVDAVRRVLNDPSLAARLAEGARRTVAGLGWVTRARKIKEFVDRRLEARRRR